MSLKIDKFSPDFIEQISLMGPILVYSDGSGFEIEFKPRLFTISLHIKDGAITMTELGAVDSFGCRRWVKFYEYVNLSEKEALDIIICLYEGLDWIE